MKITLFLLLFVTFQVYSENGYSQSTKISISHSNLKMSELLSQIESQTDYLFVYNKKNVDTQRIVNIKSTNKAVSEVLNEAFKGTGIKMELNHEDFNIPKTENFTVCFWVKANRYLEIGSAQRFSAKRDNTIQGSSTAGNEASEYELWDAVSNTQFFANNAPSPSEMKHTNSMSVLLLILSNRKFTS